MFPRGTPCYSNPSSFPAGLTRSEPSERCRTPDTSRSGVITLTDSSFRSMLRRIPNPRHRFRSSFNPTSRWSISEFLRTKISLTLYCSLAVKSSSPAKSPSTKRNSLSSPPPGQCTGRNGQPRGGARQPGQRTDRGMVQHLRGRA